MDMEELKIVKWEGKTYKEFIGLLSTLSDEDYGKFNAKMIPEIGVSFNVRMPFLRKISKSIEKNKDRDSFYNFVSSGNSYEEKLLQGIMLGKIEFKSSTDMFINIDYYILKINNWALCDSFVSNIKPLVVKNKDLFFESSKKYLDDKNPWAIRFALVLLNNYFMEERYLPEIFQRIKNIKSQEYYVNMAIAWLVSSCYVIDKILTKSFIAKGYLDDWCTNKSIQKIVESLRVTTEDKEEIKKLKIRKSEMI